MLHSHTTTASSIVNASGRTQTLADTLEIAIVRNFDRRRNVDSDRLPEDEPQIPPTLIFVAVVVLLAVLTYLDSRGT